AAAQKRQKDYYDKKHHMIYFEPDELVWLHMEKVEKGLSRKLSFNFKGPYHVVERLGEQVYLVVNVHNPRDKQKVYIRRMKKSVLDGGQLEEYQDNGSIKPSCVKDSWEDSDDDSE